MSQPVMNETTEMELSQKQKQQLNSRLAFNLENEREYSDDEYMSDEEDPTPKWNLPNWKGNNKCTGCVTRIMQDGDKRGCEECDEIWNLPELCTMEELSITTKKCEGCVTRNSSYGTTRGCEECDENWDMPDLEEEEQVVYCDEIDENESYEREDYYDKADDPYLAERLYMQRELNGELDEDEFEKPYCEGCELLYSGLGGENQMSHACMGY
jgi:hypothetical protein